MEGCTASISFSNCARVMVVTQAGSFLSTLLSHSPLMVTTVAVAATSGAAGLAGLAVGAGVAACAGFAPAAWPKAETASRRQTKQYLYISGNPPEAIKYD